jgi:hypothetical protein
MKGKRKDGKFVTKSLSRKIMSLPSSKLEHNKVENFLRRLNPSAQRIYIKPPRV